MISKLLAIAGALLGAASACYWYLSSILKVTESSPLYTENNLNGRYIYANEVVVSGGDVQIPLLATLLETSRLNKIAALFTAASILSQSVAGLLQIYA